MSCSYPSAIAHLRVVLAFWRILFLMEESPWAKLPFFCYFAAPESDQGAQMFFTAQVAVCIVLLGYFWQLQAYLHRRNRRTWEFLTAQLHRYPGNSRSPWIRLQCARVTMEMADYAERNGDRDSAMPDRTQLISLRRNAMEMRFASLRALLGIALPQPAN